MANLLAAFQSYDEYDDDDDAADDDADENDDDRCGDLNCPTCGGN